MGAGSPMIQPSHRFLFKPLSAAMSILLRSLLYLLLQCFDKVLTKSNLRIIWLTDYSLFSRTMAGSQRRGLKLKLWKNNY